MNKKLLREELVKTSEEFDENLFIHRDNDLAKRTAQIYSVLDHGKSILEEKSSKPKCTYCGSVNIKKIGILNRVISTELFGLASKKIGK